MQSKNSEKLLDAKLYTGKDFQQLRNIYALIENDIINNNSENNNNQSESNNQTNKNIIKAENNISNKNKDHLMYPELFKLYSEISKDQEEKLKDDEDYQRFLNIYERRHQTTSEYLKMENFPPLRFAKKKKKKI